MRRLVALAVVVLAAAACGGDDSTTDSTRSTSRSTTPAPQMPDGFVAAGFDSVRVRVFDADGIECAICTWRADTDSERARGLMDVTDLGGAFGMVFAYDSPADSSFWMKDTLVPLTIVYYDADGAYVGAQDMEPCAPGTECAVYPPPGEFTYAIEVLQGTAEALKLVSGSTIAIGDPCTPDPSVVAATLGDV